MEKTNLINSITLSLISKGDFSVDSIKEVITSELSNYSVIKMNTTLPSTGDGSATKYLFAIFAKGKLSAGVKANSIKQYKDVVAQLYKFTGKEINLVTSEDIIDFLNMFRAKKCKPSTIRGKYQYLSAVYGYLFDHKYIADNPITSVDCPKQIIQLKTPLNDMEVERIRMICEDFNELKKARDVAMVNFMLDSGVRVAEFCSINIQDVNFYEKTVKISGKGDKERIVSFSDRTLMRLQEYLRVRKDISFENGNMIYAYGTQLFTPLINNGRRWNVEGVEAEVRSIAKLSGITRLHPHLFRATFATNLALRGVDIAIIAKMLGHANLHTINRYVLISDKQLTKFKAVA